MSEETTKTKLPATSLFHILCTNVDPYTSGEDHTKSLHGYDKPKCIAATLAWLHKLYMRVYMEQLTGKHSTENDRTIAKQAIDEINEKIASVEAKLMFTMSDTARLNRPQELVAAATFEWTEIYVYELCLDATL